MDQDHHYDLWNTAKKAINNTRSDLPQLRIIDSKRLMFKFDRVSDEALAKVREKIIAFLQ